MSSTPGIARTVMVDLGERSYPIFIGTGMLAAGRESARDILRQYIAGSQVVIVTNDVVGPLMLEGLRGLLDSNAQVDVFTLPDGEAQKSLANYTRIIDFLITQRHNRTTTLIALGGGVVGDITGFAAATYQRGVRFIQIPTTLLAQVDSSVGGKTAVNHSAGKNLIGSFHQPALVLADLDLLNSLPDREFRAGLAEVLKYGVIADSEFFHWLCANRAGLLAREKTLLIHAVARSCEIKAQIVAADEQEAGVRALLNFGHTFGHALEALTHYSSLLHGQAVAIGMVMAADLSARLGVLQAADARQIRKAVADFGLPVAPPPLQAEQMALAMGMDKKVVDGRLRLILARRIGEAYVAQDVGQRELRATLSAGESLCLL
ncbi:MAG: 3-dehydroquinate synthase [Pseudomonadales bacterium]|nr:3-dehydroquinate synthase [Pseudomonadales bacterium]